MLMAVCRGKMSEGIDFADRHGRAVIVTGIPFPAYYDPRVVLKRSFMDELVPQARSEGRTPVTGEQWYLQQAARAVNQAIGRVIRHRKDYGVILLCDERFAGWTNQSLLSKWMKDKVQIMETFGPVAGKVSRFFAMHKQSDCPPSSDSAAASAGAASHGQVAIHSRPVPPVKAQRKDHQKVATAFPIEEEYRVHKDKTRAVRQVECAAPGSGLGSWMAGFDDETSNRANASAPVKTAEKPQSLADRLISMHAGASVPSRQTPQTGSTYRSSHGAGVADAARVPVQAATPGTVARSSRILPDQRHATGADGGQMTLARAKTSTAVVPLESEGAGVTPCLPSTSTGPGRDQRGSKTDPGHFMASIRDKLAKDDYGRFKKAMTALKAGDEPKRLEAFDELHAVLGNQQTKHVLEELLTFLSRKLREQMQAHLASKGVFLGALPA